MKNSTTLFFRFNLLLLLFAGLPLSQVWGQCAGIQVEHGSGTQQVGCTEVTVTFDGSVGLVYPSPCFYGPYWVGQYSPGSYTFSFNPPIAGVKIDVQTIDKVGIHEEEMRLEINGSFYAITSPGTDNNCQPPAIITPTGAVGCNVPNSCGWRDISITQSITTLKIENNWVSGTPAGFTASLYICCDVCQTDAGIMTAVPVELCASEIAVVPPAEQAVLDGDDLLQYIFYSNPSDILGSIITTSNTPEFAYVPASMGPGIPYYIAAIAGDNLNGNVDLNDDCINISNGVEVVWLPLPEVTFYSFDCLIPGDCYEVVVAFYGSPPFQLSGDVISGNNVLSSFSGTYTSNQGQFLVCLPDNTPLGDITIQATGLTDGNCTCN